MTASELLSTFVRLTADLYQQLEEEQADHAATRADVAALHTVAAERETTIAALHDHIADLERPPRVPSCGHPPT